MQSRIDFTKADPRALQPLFSLEQHLRGSGLPAKLLNLVRMRASQ